jgi:hypothetical protein
MVTAPTSRSTELGLQVYLTYIHISNDWTAGSGILDNVFEEYHRELLQSDRDPKTVERY